MKSPNLVLPILGLTLVSVSLPAAELEAVQDQPVLVSSEADIEWQALKALGTPESPLVPDSTDPAVIAQARQEAIAKLVGDADNLKEFRTENPTHAEAKEAKRLEALVLVQAWRLGDTSQDIRRTQLVAEIRQDTTIPAAKRAQVAALADHVGVSRRTDLSPAARLPAYEQIVRALTAEFPELPNGYESLVQIAKHSPDENAAAIARDLVGMPATPEWLKAEARAIVDRQALLGESLPELASRILAPGNAIERAQGRPTLIFSWATFSRGSIALAKEIASGVPAGVAVIGVNLDRRDLGPARTLAEELPGDHIYDWLGRHGEFAQRLKLIDPGLVYLAGKDGRIFSISAQRDLAAALAALAAQ